MKNDNVTPIRPEQGNTAVHAEETAVADVRAAIRAALHGDKHLTQARIAKECGVGASGINQWIAGKYAGDNAALEAMLRRWLIARHERQQVMRDLPTAPDYAPTPTGETILRALKFAQFGADVVVIYGAAGVGKTSAVNHYAATMPSVFIATMTPAASGVVPALEEIAHAVGADVTAGGGARLHRSIIARLRATNGLLVVDEAQHLTPAALDQVRAMHDAAGIGLALVGNEFVYTRMTGGTRAAAFDRLYSRIGKRVKIAGATVDDADVIADAWGITDRDSRAMLAKTAREAGALRSVTKVLRMAFAGARRRPSAADLVGAWRELCGGA